MGLIQKDVFKRGSTKPLHGRLKRKGVGGAPNIVRNKKRRKSGELTKLKKRLWQLCRQITIKRYGNTCYTCGNKGLVGANLHTGHFITSSTCSTEMRYDLENLRPQDYRCNIHLSGNWPEFEAHLLRDGIDVDVLKKRNFMTKGKAYPLSWFESKITEYTLLASQPPVINSES